jgi:hypothetical protein
MNSHRKELVSLTRAVSLIRLDRHAALQQRLSELVEFVRHRQQMYWPAQMVQTPVQTSGAVIGG